MLLTERFPRFKVGFPGENDVLEALVGTVRDGRIHDEDQTRLETSP